MGSRERLETRTVGHRSLLFEIRMYPLETARVSPRAPKQCRKGRFQTGPHGMFDALSSPERRFAHGRIRSPLNRLVWSGEPLNCELAKAR